MEELFVEAADSQVDLSWVDVATVPRTIFPLPDSITQIISIGGRKLIWTKQIKVRYFICNFRTRKLHFRLPKVSPGIPSIVVRCIARERMIRIDVVDDINAIGLAAPEQAHDLSEFGFHSVPISCIP